MVQAHNERDVALQACVEAQKQLRLEQTAKSRAHKNAELDRDKALARKAAFEERHKQK